MVLHGDARWFCSFDISHHHQKTWSYQLPLPVARGTCKTVAIAAVSNTETMESSGVSRFHASLTHFKAYEDYLDSKVTALDVFYFKVSDSRLFVPGVGAFFRALYSNTSVELNKPPAPFSPPPAAWPQQTNLTHFIKDMQLISPY